MSQLSSKNAWERMHGIDECLARGSRLDHRVKLDLRTNNIGTSVIKTFARSVGALVYSRFRSIWLSC
jgi:uncharacterized protein YmfQ (DUF2313 family)